MKFEVIKVYLHRILKKLKIFSAINKAVIRQDSINELTFLSMPIIK